ncbi:pentapeptide repeat-containing protein [Mycobacterium ulcerans]|uniref:Pentapeptide repeat-containing protein n=1 Tax=Mycobacterium ulcerans TaxID=1809 RepID=A0ABY3V740_MYCUL|nr:pentapeptide repeat-containing protein [Mycobacterium ulcerans]UDM34812.1 pentapeptide repeat-containing protein [Mycobacterium ulcerans]ULP52115.1 pentapeptide repeat-containing protein [Mycobacterium ulcerans]
MGSTNTGGANQGDYNTGWLNLGDYNTGLANVGKVNTGALISGNYDNGILWRSDYRAQGGFSYAIGLVPITTSLNLSVPIDIPISATVGNTVIEGFTIPEIPIGAYGVVSGNIGPETFPTITIVGPTIDIGVGGTQSVFTPSFVVDTGLVQAIVLDLPSGPGVGNSTSVESSGFFNSGDGSASGFGNGGGSNSGFLNFATDSLGNSGFKNYGKRWSPASQTWATAFPVCSTRARWTC